MMSALRKPLLVVSLLAAALAFGGCGSRALSPSSTPVGDQAPVGLRSLQATATDGNHAMLLRLTRLPTMVRHSSSSDPAQITIQAWGPKGGGDLPERTLPQEDSYVRQVRVSRKGGVLKVVLDLQGDVPPPHMVHEMADWIMVRFGGPGS